MKKCIVIYNPISGKKIKYNFMPEFRNTLEKYGYDYQIVETDHKFHAIEIMEEIPDVDLVISSGGDGTFNEVMTGNYRRKNRLVLAHMPVGSTNDIGKMLGYKDNIITNLKLALEGTVKNMDICIINNRPFVYVAGMCKLTDVSYDTPRKLKNKIGYLAYIKEGIKAFFQKTNLYDVEYEINGEKYRGLFSFVLVSSANRIAGIKGFYKDVKLDDDNFEVLMCSITRKKDIIKSLYFLTKYDISKVPGFYFYQSNNMKIRLSKPLKKEWCIDGEKLEDNGDKFNIHIDNDFKVLVPNKNIDELFIDTSIKKF